MATSAKTLEQIIDTISTEFKLDKPDIFAHLALKELLPAKLAKKPETKQVTIFASKKAEEFASEGSISPNPGNGSGKDGKYTLSDIKQLLEPVVTQKVLISSKAVKYAKDEKVEISQVTGTGKEGRILLTDVQKWKAESIKIESDSESESESESD